MLWYQDLRTVNAGSSLPVAAARGAVGGLVASGAMSLALLGMYRLLPRWQRYDDPPRQITRRILRRVGLKTLVDDEPEQTLSTAIGHFGYGAAAGTLYGGLASGLEAPTLVKGILAGIAVFLVSYMGWLPAFQILPPATKMPKSRAWMMLAGHLVWGIITALLTDRLSSSKGRKPAW
jgi:uncharacterized membrane protein YagU involved in acid resistance